MRNIQISRFIVNESRQS